MPVELGGTFLSTVDLLFCCLALRADVTKAVERANREKAGWGFCKWDFLVGLRGIVIIKLQAT